MALAWNARGDTAANMVMWFAGLTAALIAVYWLMGTVFPVQTASRNMGTDLEALTNSINDACTSIYYNATYNPKTEYGELISRQSSICINISSIVACRNVLCYINDSEPIILKDITYVIILRTGGENISITSR